MKEQIKIYLERGIGLTGMTDDEVPVVRYDILVVLALALAWLACFFC